MLLAGFRRALLAKHKDLIGGYLFDGMQLFAIRRLDPLMKLKSIDREEREYTVTIKFTKVVEMTSIESLQVLNLIQRRAMQTLGLQLVGRNHFDPAAMVII